MRPAPMLLAAGLLAALSWSSGGLAAEPVPVVIEAVGKGAVRFRLAEGMTAPCDSSHNRPLLRGWIDANAPRDLSVTGSCVCLEHTWGSFRETQWSPGAIFCNRPGTRRRPADHTIRVRFSTDAP